MRRVMLLIFGVAFVLAMTPPSTPAQEPKLRQWAKANQNFGMDDTTFRRLFAAVLAERHVTPLPSSTVEQLANQVVDVRLFLTAQAGIVIGEIVTTGKTSLGSITLPLEQGPVTFSDRGEAPDKKRGDGIFTARFRMNTEAEWRVARGDVAASTQALAAPGPRQFLRRGPRDIVPLREAMESLKTQAPGLQRALAATAERARAVSAATTLADAIRVGRIDIKTVPAFDLPVPSPEPIPDFEPRERFLPGRVFGIPTFPLFPPPPPPVPIDAPRSLMIVSTGVVENGARTFDPCTGAGTKGGVWSFGHLMREMSHGTGLSPEDFTMMWLSTWIIPQEANGFIVDEAARGVELQNRIIDSWQRLSGVTLDVDQFPARLLAIVNRPDLADKVGYGVAGSAGEGRFVFGLLEKPASGSGCNVLSFTVIFEFGIAGGSCGAVKAWHQRWKNLDAFALGSTAYDDALALITHDFTEHGSNPGQFPNQSALNQLRTNEIALGSPWQLREFRLQSNGAVPPGVLDLVTVKQTPDESFRNGATGTPTVAAYIVANEASILAGKHVVPDRFPGILNPFVGAKSDVPFGAFWNAPGLTSPPLTDPAEARRIFSLGTCSGCHAGETNTFFTHVSPRSAGTAAGLSGFLMGENVPIPVTGGIHHYEDLAERAKAMSNILTASCFSLLAVRRIPFVH